MKKFPLLLVLMFILLPAAQATTYQLNPAQSKIEWTGKKVTGKHNGIIGLKKGSLILEGEKITGGSFEIDMSTIQVLDIKDPKSNKKLEGHLKSDDFFSVEKFPQAKFTITSVRDKGSNQVEVLGKLTIKGITHPVTIPATLKKEGDTLSAKGTVTLDRTQWDVRYGSGKFFKGLGDKLIYDEFDLTLDLYASE